MDHLKAMDIAKALVDAGWDVTVHGRAGNEGSVINAGWPEAWTVSVSRRQAISSADFQRLCDLVDVVGLDVYFDPTNAGGLWLQEAR